jgi:thiamine kinase-like enzyme
MQPFPAEVAWLITQPRTLVHGDPVPENLIVAADSRIRPLDWECAAIGLGAWDLARLLDGWGADPVDFIAAYLAELDRLDASPLDLEAFRRIYHRSGRVLNALCRLRASGDACRDPAFVVPLLDKIEAAWAPA